MKGRQLRAVARAQRPPGLCTSAAPGPAQRDGRSGDSLGPALAAARRTSCRLRGPCGLGRAPLARPPGPLPRAPAGRGPGRLPVFQVASQHLALRPSEDPGWEPNERGSGAPGRAGKGAVATSTGRRERAVRAAAPARRFRGNAARAPAVKSRARETRGHWREGPLSIPLRGCSQASPAAGSEEENQPTLNRKGDVKAKVNGVRALLQDVNLRCACPRTSLLNVTMWAFRGRLWKRDLY